MSIKPNINVLKRGKRVNKKLYFASDYAKGAHPSIMKRMADTNMLETAGYECGSR